MSIVEIAKLAGVSHTTVSRVIRGITEVSLVTVFVCLNIWFDKNAVCCALREQEVNRIKEVK